MIEYIRAHTGLWLIDLQGIDAVVGGGQEIDRRVAGQNFDLGMGFQGIQQGDFNGSTSGIGHMKNTFGRMRTFPNKGKIPIFISIERHLQFINQDPFNQLWSVLSNSLDCLWIVILCSGFKKILGQAFR